MKKSKNKKFPIQPRENWKSKIDYKIGDQVQVVQCKRTGMYHMYLNCIGKIKKNHPDDKNRFFVVFKYKDYDVSKETFEAWFDDSELELICK
jgi:hypothetical protein